MQLTIRSYSFNHAPNHSPNHSPNHAPNHTPDNTLTTPITIGVTIHQANHLTTPLLVRHRLRNRRFLPTSLPTPHQSGNNGSWLFRQLYTCFQCGEIVESYNGQLMWCSHMLFMYDPSLKTVNNDVKLGVEILVIIVSIEDTN